MCGRPVRRRVSTQAAAVRGCGQYVALRFLGCRCGGRAARRVLRAGRFQWRIREQPPARQPRTRTANAQLWRIDAHDAAAAVADNCAVGVLPRSSPTGCNAHAPCQRCRRSPSHNDSDAATQRCPCRLNPCTAQRSPTATPDSHRTIGTAAMIGRGALHLPKNLSWPTPPPASIHAMTDLFASAPPALDGIHIGIGGWVYAPWRAGMF